MNKWEWYQPISEEIFNMKYKFHRKDILEVFSDVAKVVASIEKIPEKYESIFFKIMANKEFIPAGRILANAWINSKVKNLGNCFTINIEDSIEGIYDTLSEDALVSKEGGGVGFDISPLRPEGSILSTGGDASGPVSFLKIFDQSAKVIHTGGKRRSAHLALIDVSHPDIEKFITCKQGDNNKELTQFNISIKFTEKFIKAIENDENWDLVFNKKIYKTLKARELYNKFAYNAFMNNEPGVFNVDIINKYSNSYYLERIEQSNACSEQPLPKYSACNLGAMYLPTFVKNSFNENSFFDFNVFSKSIYTAIRFMDNVIDVSEYPLEKINEIIKKERRVGLGFTGLADTMTMLKIKYGSEESKVFSEKLGKTLRDVSYKASVELAKEKGSFPWFDSDKFINSNFIKQLDKELKNDIKKHGIRNITLNTIAPTGTISLTIGQNCSSGVEPIFSLSYTRTIRTGKNDETKKEKVYDYAWLLYLSKQLNIPIEEAYKTNITKIPDYFVTAIDIDPIDAIDIQSIFQKYIDASISKTHSLKPGTTFEEYKNLFLYAYKKGLKGFTTYNPDGNLKGIIEYDTLKKDIKKDIKKDEKITTSSVCLKCSSKLIFQDGCIICSNCGWSKCDL